MADDGSASNPRDPLKSSAWNVAVQRRRQRAVTVSKERRELRVWAKRLCTNGSRRYDVFPSFSGEDVRKSFLSHFLKELDRRRFINTFIDHGIERSRPIAPELFSAIRGSRIAIVVFSKKYASSTWCLDELVEIRKCYKEFGQMVIPVFYNVDPSQVRKQTGEFGKVFNKTCKGKPEDLKQRWMQALTDVANLAGEDLHNWIHCNFIGRWNKVGYLHLELIYNTDHLVLVPVKFRNNDLELEFSDDDYESSPYVEFEFSVVNYKYELSPFQRIKGCGIRVLEMSPSPTSSDESKKPML